MKDKFTELYEQVFDETGNIKACGRDLCMQLIDYVEKTFNIEVGREETGFINNKDLIIDLYNAHKLKCKGEA